MHQTCDYTGKTPDSYKHRCQGFKAFRSDSAATSLLCFLTSSNWLYTVVHWWPAIFRKDGRVVHVMLLSPSHSYKWEFKWRSIQICFSDIEQLWSLFCFELEAVSFVDFVSLSNHKWRHHLNKWYIYSHYSACQHFSFTLSLLIVHIYR